MVLGDRRQRRPAVLGEEQGEVVAQRILQLRADGLIVVDNEKFRLIHHASVDVHSVVRALTV